MAAPQGLTPHAPGSMGPPPPLADLLARLWALLGSPSWADLPSLREAVEKAAAVLVSLRRGRTPRALKDALLLGKGLEKVGRGLWPPTAQSRTFLADCVKAIGLRLGAAPWDGRPEAATDAAATATPPAPAATRAPAAPPAPPEAAPKPPGAAAAAAAPTSPAAAEAHGRPERAPIERTADDDSDRPTAPREVREQPPAPAPPAARPAASESAASAAGGEEGDEPLVFLFEAEGDEPLLVPDDEEELIIDDERLLPDDDAR